MSLFDFFKGDPPKPITYPKVEIKKRAKYQVPKGNLNIKGTGINIDAFVKSDFSKELIESKFDELGFTVTDVDFEVGGKTETHALYVPEHHIDVFLSDKVKHRIMGKFGLKEKPEITLLKGDWVDPQGNPLREDIIEITFKRITEQPVHLGDYLNSKSYWKTKGELVFPLGRGNGPLFADLANFPHGLWTGTSGAGKSESLNGMILSIHHRYTRSDVQFAFIDPKLLEMAVYENSPLIAYYANQDKPLKAFFTDVNDSINYLSSLVLEMERRYRKLLDARVKDIKKYNQKHPKDKMPYLVCIIDEFAKLVEVGDNDQLFSAVKRLTAEARASGIILVIATQTPRADVLPGQILGNLLTRVIFKTGNKTESDQVLKVPEASHLTGMGDGYYIDKRGEKHRFTGVFLDETVDVLEQIITWEP